MSAPTNGDPLEVRDGRLLLCADAIQRTAGVRDQDFALRAEGFTVVEIRAAIDFLRKLGYGAKARPLKGGTER